ncbi:hypothetical protein [Oceanibacterium hippocampi]|uniref:Uncharacterized protein n=1 Tax=Oceanibacterium hippocampi TaxID=745714 RepID=A0A1Y5RYU5_9PROT|nr:hypothetical protein [Oceanibacterium hippocampi]SLN28397.1 hypothetical protein OCH7691_00950 [Oceanibacterium hippocampi]
MTLAGSPYLDRPVRSYSDVVRQTGRDPLGRERSTPGDTRPGNVHHDIAGNHHGDDHDGR